MTHTYSLTGMTCSSCEATIKSALLLMPNVTNVEVSKVENSATITMDKHIAIGDFQKALNEKDSRYKITATQHNEIAEQTQGWLSTYKPILLIFAYITLVSLLIQLKNETFNWMEAMRHFMAGFFLVFSFFKLLNLKGFADSYAMYDVVAMRYKNWGYAYAIIELLLSLAYLINYNALITNIATLMVMSISIIGVVKTVLNKQKIQCACLGAVFNLPMSTVTIIEDALMIAMSAIMLLKII